MKVNIIEQHEPPQPKLFKHLDIPTMCLFLAGIVLVGLVENCAITYPLLLLLGCAAVYVRYQRFVKETEEGQDTKANSFTFYLDIIVGLLFLMLFDALIRKLVYLLTHI